MCVNDLHTAEDADMFMSCRGSAQVVRSVGRLYVQTCWQVVCQELH